MTNKIRAFIRPTTSKLIIFSFVGVTFLVFAIITTALNSQLYQFIANRTNQYVRAVVSQIEWQLNSSLNSIDIEIQRLSTDLQTQYILYGMNQNPNNHVLTSEGRRILRSKIMEALVFAETIQSIHIYGHTGNLYPGTQATIEEVMSPEILSEAELLNGGMVWYVDNERPNLIFGIRKLLLPEYDFQSAGYLVVSIGDDFLYFIHNELLRIEGGAIVISDNNGNVLARYESQHFYATYSASPQSFDVVASRSNYTNWQISIYAPRLMQERDAAWLNQLLIIAFSSGVILLIFGGLLIAHYITSPLRDMNRFIEQSNWPLEANSKLYFNVDVDTLNKQFNLLVERSNHLIEERINEEQLRSIAELKALESQVNPHFIINAMESIYWFLMGRNEGEGADIVLSIAKLYKYILKAQDWLPLKDELDFVRGYMQIEQFRFTDRLNFIITAEEAYLNRNIPKLLIQPLVENSVKHGVESGTDTVTIKVDVYSENGDMVVCVKDDGKGISPERMETILKSFEEDNPVGSVSSSYGLANLKKRLETYYGSRASLEIQSNESQAGSIVTIRLIGG